MSSESVPTTLRIFLATPPDVGEERQIAKHFLAELREKLSSHFQLEIGGNEPIPANATSPAHLLHPAQFDIVISIFWSYLGPPLPAQLTFADNVPLKRPNGSRYESIMVAVFEEALTAAEMTGKPILLTLVKTAPLNPQDPQFDIQSGQQQAVKNFIKKWFLALPGQQTRSYIQFNHLKEFERILVSQLHSLLQQHFLPSELSSLLTWSKSPFRGLQPFTAEYTPVLFGRDQAIAEIVQRLSAWNFQAQAPSFLLITGPIGSGKSSLIRAGVLPLFAKLGIPSHIFHPSEAIADIVAGLKAVVAEMEPVSTAASPKKLAGLLFIDQLEELFTIETISNPVRHEFIQLLDLITRNSLIGVLAALPSEFLPRFNEFTAMLELIADKRHYFLLPPTATEIQHIIAESIQLTGLHFDSSETHPSLESTLLAEIATVPDNKLALLEFTLSTLYEQHTTSNRSTYAIYQEIGGVKDALAHVAEQLFSQLSEAEQQEWHQLIYLLVTIEPTHFIPFTAQPVAQDRLTTNEIRTELVNKLIASQLLIRHDQAQPVVCIMPTALLSNWSRLQKWLTEERDLLRVRTRIAAAAAAWQAQEQAPDLLLPDSLLLTEAEDLLWQWEETLADHEKAYLEASIAQRQQELETREQTYQYRERRQRRINKQLILLILLITIVTGMFFWRWWGTHQQIQTYQDQKQLALSRQVAAQALLAAYHPNPTHGYFNHALLLATQAIQFQRTPETQATLLKVLQSNPHLENYWYWPKEQISSLAFSPDGKQLAYANQDNKLVLWDLDNQTPLGQPLEGHSDTITHLAFNPFGTQLISASADNTIIIWDLETQLPIAEPWQHHETISSIAISPDGTQLATGSDDNSVKLWNLETRQPIGEPLAGHTDKINSMVFSPDGKRLASASTDKTVRIWELTQATPSGLSLQGHNAAVQSVAFNPFGTRLASASQDSTIIIWELDQEIPLGHRLQGHHAAVRQITFSPDGKRLASANDDNTIRLWDVEQRQLLGTPWQGHSSAIRWLAFRPNNKHLVSVSEDSTLITWNLLPQPRLEQTLLRQQQGIMNVAFSPNKQWLAGATVDKSLIIWDILQQNIITTLTPRHTEEITSIAFSPNGKWLASASRDHTIKLWDIEQQTMVETPLQGHTDVINSIAFSPGGKWLASASDDKTIIIWDLATQTLIGQPLQGHHAAVQSVAFSPRRNQLASGGWDDNVIIWDVTTQTQIGTPLQGHLDAVYSIAFSPNGDYLASASRDDTIRLWNLNQHKLIGHPLQGHDHDVTSVAFSPDGHWLASGSWDETIKLWDVKTQTRLGILTGHTSFISNIVFSPDGQWLASVSLDKTVKLWEVNQQSWLKRACHIAGRHFTQAEWQHYFNDEPYQLTCSNYFNAN